MKIFSVNIEWPDNPGAIENVLFCDLDEVVDGQGGYTDDDIFFYGLDGDELNRLVESQDAVHDFKVKEFWVLYEDN